MIKKKHTSNVNEQFGHGLPDIVYASLLQFDPIWATQEHSSESCELLHVVSGNMELVTREFRVEAKAGDTLLIPDKMMNRDEFPPDQDLEVFLVMFSWPLEAEYFRRIAPGVPLNLSPRYKKNLSLLFDELRGDILGSTAEESRLLARARVLTILLLIMDGLCKTCESSEDGQHSSTTTEDRHKALVEAAKLYMQQNFVNLISLEDIAEHLGVSAYHLSHVFGKQSDFTAYGYLMMLRMEKARTLLKEAKFNVSEVAYAVGYRDPDYFSKVFKKHFGHSPSEC